MKKSSVTRKIDREYNKSIRNWVKIAYLNLDHWNRLVTHLHAELTYGLEPMTQENILASAKRSHAYFS